MKFAPPDLPVRPDLSVGQHVPVREEAPLSPAMVAGEGSAEGLADSERTRDRVCSEVLARGPVSVAALAGAMGLTPAAVRRHLDVLGEQGMVEVREPRAKEPRGRGRPARLYLLTDAGHSAMNTGYEDLAGQALHYLAEVAGRGAVASFARARSAAFEARYRPVVEAVGADPVHRAEALASALSHDGFAATTRVVREPLPISGRAGGRVTGPGRGGKPTRGPGTQLCQGHCPVQHVARLFPELCDAETATFSRLLGVHVQRLATLAHGEHVCTTHIPAPARPIAAGPDTTAGPDTAAGSAGPDTDAGPGSAGRHDIAARPDEVARGNAG